MSGPLALVEDTDVLRALRALQPNRTLSWSEAHSVAERQAALLLDLVHIDEPPVPQFVISAVPEVSVEWLADWPTDATSFQAGSGWRIVLRATDSRQRQRFSLAHEFGHIVPDPVVDRLHAHLDPKKRHEREERLANYFAACLLMPRPWIKHDYGSGMQTPWRLAKRYYVSTEAMRTRLVELGLVPKTQPGRSAGRHLRTLP